MSKTLNSFNLLDAWMMLKSALTASFATVAIPLGISYFFFNSVIIERHNVAFLISMAIMSTVILYKHEKKKHKENKQN